MQLIEIEFEFNDRGFNTHEGIECLTVGENGELFFEGYTLDVEKKKNDRDRDSLFIHTLCTYDDNDDNEDKVLVLEYEKCDGERYWVSITKCIELIYFLNQFWQFRGDDKILDRIKNRTFDDVLLLKLLNLPEYIQPSLGTFYKNSNGEIYKIIDSPRDVDGSPIKLMNYGGSQVVWYQNTVTTQIKVISLEQFCDLVKRGHLTNFPYI